MKLSASRWRQKTQRRGNPQVVVAIGVIGLIICGFEYLSASADANGYDGAASCRMDVARSATSDRTCRVEPMQITRVYRTSGKGASTHLILVGKDAKTMNVRFGKNQSGNVIDGFRNGQNRDATVQFFKNDAVVIETGSGSLETDKFPAERAQAWAFGGIVAGIIGLAGAIASSLRPRAVAMRRVR